MKYIKRYNSFKEFQTNEIYEEETRNSYMDTESNDVPYVGGIKTNDNVAFYNKNYKPNDSETNIPI